MVWQSSTVGHTELTRIVRKLLGTGFWIRVLVTLLAVHSVESSSLIECFLKRSANLSGLGFQDFFFTCVCSTPRSNGRHRAARWFLFRPKLPKFWRTLYWKRLVYFMCFWNILQPYGIFKLHWVILLSLGIFFPGLVYCTRKNLATLGRQRKKSIKRNFGRVSSFIRRSSQISGRRHNQDPWKVRLAWQYPFFNNNKENGSISLKFSGSLLGKSCRKALVENCFFNIFRLSIQCVMLSGWPDWVITLIITEIGHILGILFNVMVMHVLGYILGDFFSISSGHLVCNIIKSKLGLTVISIGWPQNSF
jgi:hypothetical protein